MAGGNRAYADHSTRYHSQKSARPCWEKAQKYGLIRQDQLDALDRLKPAYAVRIIGDYEFWVRRPA